MKFFKKLFNKKKKADIETLMEEARTFSCSPANPKHEIRRKFIIPIGDMSEEDRLKLAENQIQKLMSEYKEDVDWDNIKLPNNDENLYFDKDYWFPIKNKD